MPNLSGRVLNWARETAGLSLVQAAHKLGLRDSKKHSAVEKLRAIESSGSVSRPVLLKMSKQYRRPLLLFYMNAPPEIAYRGEDYRKLSHDIDPVYEGIVDAIVRDVRVRQSIIKAAVQAEGDVRPIEVVSSYNLGDGVEGLCRRIRQAGNIDVLEYRRQRNQDNAFNYLRERVESVGIYTLLAGNLGSYHTDVSTEYFRGFALADPVAPFIVINDNDAKAAWSFTLLHEAAHIWLGRTGMSGKAVDHQIEQFCNDVASNVLLSEEEFREVHIEFLKETGDQRVASINRYASRYKVSSSLIAYRLLRSEAISFRDYEALRAEFYRRWIRYKQDRRISHQEQDGGPSYYVVRRAKLGNAVLNTARRLLATGELSTVQAAKVLGVRPLKVGSILRGQDAA